MKSQFNWEKGARSKTAVIVALLILAVIILITKIRISTDLTVFLPEPATKVERLLHQQLSQGTTTNLVFIALSNLSSEQLAKLNKQIAVALEQNDVIKNITNTNSQFGDKELEFVIQNRYLLTHNNLDEKFSVDGLRKSLQDRLEGIVSTSGVLEKQLLVRDPTGEVLSLLDAWQGKLQSYVLPHEKHGVWFSKDESRSLILAELNIRGANLDAQAAAIKSIRRIFAQYNPGVATIQLTGPAVFAVETSDKIRDDVKLMSIVAISLVMLFLILVYRSIITLLLVILPLVFGVIMAAAAILLMYGEIHGITLAFGITLTGVAIDYPIHLVTSMAHHHGNRIEKVIKIWPTLRLGVVSTILAYAAFIVSGFGGLQQLGIFTVIGLAVTAVISRWILPNLVPVSTKLGYGFQPLHHRLKIIGYAAPRYRWLVIVLVLATLIGLAITDRPIRDLDVNTLSPINKQRRAMGQMLRADLGFWSGGRMLIVMANDDEKVLQISEQLQPELDRLVERDVIRGYNMAAQFLPSQALQRERLDKLPDQKTLQQRFDQISNEFPFKRSIFQPFFEQVESARKAKLLTMKTLVDSSVGEKLESLLTSSADQSVGIILLHGVTDQQAINDFVAEQQHELYYIHLKQASTHLVERSIDRVFLIMQISILLIYFTMAWSFRLWRRPLKVIIPSLAATILVVGILVLSGTSLNVFHLISLFLVIGLGLDYALFFNRLPNNQAEWDTTFRSLWVCATTTILVFGILMFSDIPPLQAIGMTVTIGASLSMLFAAMWANVAEPIKWPKNQPI